MSPTKKFIIDSPQSDFCKNPCKCIVLLSFIFDNDGDYSDGFSEKNVFPVHTGLQTIKETSNQGDFQALSKGGGGYD